MYCTITTYIQLEHLNFKADDILECLHEPTGSVTYERNALKGQFGILINSW